MPDGSARAAVTPHPEAVPSPPELMALMPKILADSTSETERAEFGRPWQMRVKHFLIDHCDAPALLTWTVDPQPPSA